LSAARVALTELPGEVTKRLPRYPTLRALRIVRLAVDEKFQGRGLDAAMLMNAVHRTLQGAAAAFTLLVDAKNDRAVVGSTSTTESGCW
jgi:ribosomal protein S18 acetylase RimI-like enzyme